MFTDKAQALIDRSKDFAFAEHLDVLDLRSILAVIRIQSEARILLAECLGISADELRDKCPELQLPEKCSAKFTTAEALREVLQAAQELAREVPDYYHPGLIDVRHIAGALAMSTHLCSLISVIPKKQSEILSILASWYREVNKTPRLHQLTERLRNLRTELLASVFGQDHAIQSFVDGLFNAELVAGADDARKGPRAIFVFAGPPGVGKTLLAEQGAARLERPFKRFDMSAYSALQQNDALVGLSKSFQGAHAGTLTEFVEKNPNAVLLFDEIEKAHIKTILLFLQVLDAGILEDKYHERNVSFRDTIVIFTTNAGKSLYEQPNRTGVASANARYHRRTVINALETEIDPQTGVPFFPSAICSRLSTGYPVLFNHLGVNELEKVAQAQLQRTAQLVLRQYYKTITFDDLVAICLVLREGVRVDARSLRAQTEAFAKNEIYKICQLFKTERLEEALSSVDSIHFDAASARASMPAELISLFQPKGKPKILLVADGELCQAYQNRIEAIEWKIANSATDALELLAREEVDLVLLDLWLGGTSSVGLMSIRQFDHVPAATRRLDQGQELLRQMRDRLPHVPVFLLSIQSDDNVDHGSTDEDLYLSCMRAGGARGLVNTALGTHASAKWKEHRDELVAHLQQIALRLHRETAAFALGQQRKVLAFETVPKIDASSRTLTVSFRNLRTGRAVESADAGGLLDDIERPNITFDDVVGAEEAKSELRFYIEYLKDPKRFAALGLKPPKGVLLHGPPGTGKTLLARAVAGESNVAFISASASSFVTIWQGSGPQNIRTLFERARNYAPAIIFIDEIDAIGKARTGASGAGQAEENTLNALLTEMDGFTSSSPMRPVFVLAATNFEIDNDAQGRSQRVLDAALVRRFSRTILIDLPERAARKQYLVNRLNDRRSANISDSTLSLIAERSSGMSIANLELIIETAARCAARQMSDLSDELLEEAFETVRFGEARPREPEVVRRTAYHEAGHTVLYWLSGRFPAYVTVVSRGGHGGYMAPAADDFERQACQTREDLLAQIRVCFGGRAAEQLIYGEAGGLTTGAASDLEHATNIARQMVCRFGMDDAFGLMVTPDIWSQSTSASPLLIKASESVMQLLNEELQNARRLLDQHRGQLERIAQALIERERLTMQEVKLLLAE